MEDVKLLEKISTGVEAMATAQQNHQKQMTELTTNVSRLDAETKKALEDVEKLKKNANDIPALATAMKRVEIELRREKRLAFGDPIQRISQSDEMRIRFNLHFRELANKLKGGLNSQCEKLASDLGTVTGKALSDTATPGSITVLDVDILKEMFDLIYSFGAWSTLNVNRMSTRVTKLPVQTADPVANFILTEGGTVNDDASIAGTSVNLQVEMLAVLINVSYQLLEDSEFDITSWIMRRFANAYNQAADYVAFRGNGVADSTNAGMTGVFNYGTAVTAQHGHQNISQLDIVDFTYALTGVAAAVLQRLSARWWLHPQNLARVAAIKDGQGRSLFMSILEVPTPMGIGSLMGFPVTLVGTAPTGDGPATQVAAFGDPGAMEVGVRMDYNFEATDAFKFANLQRTFRGWGRFGVKGRLSTGLAILSTSNS